MSQGPARTKSGHAGEPAQLETCEFFEVQGMERDLHALFIAMYSCSVNLHKVGQALV